MIKLKRNIAILFCSIFLLFTSCGHKNELVEVEIPEREAFNIQKSDFPDPATIKTKQGPFEMRGLPYNFNDFHVIAKAESAFIHFDKVHLDYANRLNTAVHGTPFEKDEITTLITRIDNRYANLKNFSGAYYNHNIFWQSINPKIESKPNEVLDKLIVESFGSMNELKSELINKGNALVGSGWLWLIILPNGKLSVVTTINNESPNMPELQLGKPLLGIDLWEHAYFETYKNDKKAYIETCFTYLNWEKVNKEFIVDVESTEVK